MPLVHPNTPMTQAATLTPTTQAASSTLDFGPPPRDRRHFEASETPTQDSPSADVSKENFFEDCNLNMSNLSDVLQEAHGTTSATENFTKFLEQGCIVAEKIAIRNQHRPCFKNIQNLCNRTRSEILKPSNTVSNIHSQGIPWATKDFIYAFVRLINCWHMLKGYLDSKDGTLGNIDRELTTLLIFTNLDNNVRINPNAVVHNKIKQTLPPETSSPKIEPTINKIKEATKLNRNVTIKEATKLNRNVTNTVAAELTENLLLPESPTTPREEDSDNDLPESPTTPREEDSDNEGRVYMKPEFFDTAQNVSAHYKKIAKKKGENGITSTTDKMWQDAQSAVPYLMNKINQPQVDLSDRNADEVDALKYFVDLNTLDHQASNIQEWLNNNNFFEQQNCSDALNDASGVTTNPTMSLGFSEKPVTVLQRSQLVKMGSLVDQDMSYYSQPKSFCKNNGNRIEVQSRTYNRKKSDGSEKGFGKSANKKSCSSTWEYDKGGLTPAAWIVMDDIVKILEQEEFAKRVDYTEGSLSNKGFADDFKHVTSLATVRKKLTNRKYNYVNEFVADLKSIISCAEILYEAHHDISHSITLFDRKLDLLLNRDFFAFDFGFLTDKSDDVGPLVLKSSRKSDGDGDH
ncbi:Bromodomain [Popillia japonica]